ncbi:MAG TPA: dihydroneopterin aldolase [Puia sp.]|nr:dihydroneopterin aldolase [Puia sp.]
MLTIQLHHLTFFGHHGLHQEEQITANNFEVSLDVTYDEHNTQFNKPEDTIDYVALYNIVRGQMNITTPLLEKICDQIAGKIKNQFPLVREINVCIKKLNMPIENFHGSISVSLRKKFDE